MYTIQQGNTLITAGRVKMEPNGIGSYVKQCIVSTPFIFSEVPIVTLNVYTKTGNDAFVVYGMEHFISTGQTTFKVSATNNEIGKESADEYWCDYTIMGELAAGKD